MPAKSFLIIMKILEQKVRDQVGLTQEGFQPNRCIRDQIFHLRTNIEKSKESRINLHVYVFTWLHKDDWNP